MSAETFYVGATQANDMIVFIAIVIYCQTNDSTKIWGFTSIAELKRKKKEYLPKTRNSSISSWNEATRACPRYKGLSVYMRVHCVFVGSA